MLATITSWIIAAISALGYPGVVGLMAIESACIPLPSEIIMPFAGYLASTGRLNLVAAATAGALGCNIGSTVAYLFGAYGGRPAVLRWGRFILFDHRELDQLQGFFWRFGGLTVLVARLLPAVRTFISLPAGLGRMPLLKFQIYTFVGSWPWCFALAYVGLKLGQQWRTSPELRHFFSRFDWVAIGLIGLGFLAYLYRRWRSARN